MRSSSSGGSGRSMGTSLFWIWPLELAMTASSCPSRRRTNSMCSIDVAVGARRLHHHRQVAELAQQPRRPLHHVGHVGAGAPPNRSRISSFSPVVRLRTRSSVST